MTKRERQKRFEELMKGGKGAFCHHRERPFDTPWNTIRENAGRKECL